MQSSKEIFKKKKVSEKQRPKAPEKTQPELTVFYYYLIIILILYYFSKYYFT